MHFILSLPNLPKLFCESQRLCFGSCSGLFKHLVSTGVVVSMTESLPTRTMLPVTMSTAGHQLRRKGKRIV
ncbi:hypothetical protein HBI82_147020 [Parastagonospora nodorum]|nr:hypothetical protein HBI82_147020 [Parastagonospora nodorum]